jgi:hypothetical protein
MMTRESSPLSPSKQSSASNGGQPRTDNNKQGTAFARELNRLERKEDAQDRQKKGSDNADETDLKHGPAVRAGPQGKTGFANDRDRRDDAGLTQDVLIANAIRGAKQSFVAKTSPADVPPPHLEKIAAAIAELSAKGVEAHYQLSLPMGPTMIDGAILARDASGRMMIQLLCPAILPPLQAKQLAADLARRLLDKKMRLGEIAFSKSYAARDGRTVKRKGGA